MKKQQDAQRVRKWEKDRRDRFNVLLQALAESLPGYNAIDKETQGSKSPKKLGESWSKALIVDKATQYIKNLQKFKIPDELKKKAKHISKQNKKLKEVIRKEFDLNVTDEEFNKLSSDDILNRIASRKNEDSPSNTIHVEQVNGKVGEDVFVVPVNPIDDHSYSLKVQEDPNVVEIVTEETNQESNTIENESEKEKETTSKSDSSSNTTQNTVSQSQQPILILSQPQVLGNIPTLIPQAMISSGAILMPNIVMSSQNFQGKLPLPRLKPPISSTKTSTNSNKSTNSLKSSSIPTKKQDKKDTNKEVKELKEGKQIKISDKSQSKKTTTESTEKSPEKNKEDKLKTSSQYSFNEVTNVESALPETILASEDPDNQTTQDVVEMIDLTKDTIGNKNKESKEKENKKDGDSSKNHLKKQKRVDYESTHKSSKGSKSNYSIAALCQISANIGRTSGDYMVPDLPGFSSVEGLPVESIGTSTQSSNTTSSIAQSPSNKIVIQELAPYKSNESEKKTDNSRKSKPIQSSHSPSRSYLTSFPLVSNTTTTYTVVNTNSKSSVETSSTNTKSSTLNSEKISEKNDLGARKVYDQTRRSEKSSKPLESSLSKPSNSKEKKDLSVFDFTENKQDSIVPKTYSPKKMDKSKEITPPKKTTVPSTCTNSLHTTQTANSVAVSKSISQVPKQSHQQQKSQHAQPQQQTQDPHHSNQQTQPTTSQPSNPVSTNVSTTGHYSHSKMYQHAPSYYEGTSSSSITTSSSAYRHHHQKEAQFSQHYYSTLSSAPTSNMTFPYQTAAPSFADLEAQSITNSGYQNQQLQHNSLTNNHQASRYQNYSNQMPLPSSAIGSSIPGTSLDASSQEYQRNYYRNYCSTSNHHQYRYNMHNSDIKASDRKARSLNPSYQNNKQMNEIFNRQDHPSSLPPPLQQAQQTPSQTHTNQPPPQVLMANDKMFSVTQLVSSKQQTSRKTATKRSGQTVAGPSKSKSRNVESSNNESKEDNKRTTKSSRSTSSRSKTKPHSAESLISNTGINLSMDGVQSSLNSQHQSSQHVISNPQSYPDMLTQSHTEASKWPMEVTGQINPSSSLQLSSISPSPANIFSQDTIDFSAALFGGHDPNSSQINATSTSSGAQLSGSVALGNISSASGPSSIQPAPISSIPSGSSSSTTCGSNLPSSKNPTYMQLHSTNTSKAIEYSKRQLPSQEICQPRNNSMDQQQYLGSTLLDNNFLQPLPTITPPTNEDQMFCCYPSFMAHPPNNMFPSTSTSGSRHQSSHYYSSKSSRTTSNESHHQQHQIFSGVPPTGSVSNFHLSSIFPNLNEKLIENTSKGGHQVHPHPPMAPPPPPPSSSIPSSSSINTNPSISSTTSSSTTELRQLTTPEILPHSISILGHGSHQMSLGSVPFPGSGFHPNVVSGINFQLSDQQQ